MGGWLSEESRDGRRGGKETGQAHSAHGHPASPDCTPPGHEAPGMLPAMHMSQVRAMLPQAAVEQPSFWSPDP